MKESKEVYYDWRKHRVRFASKKRTGDFVRLVLLRELISVSTQNFILTTYLNAEIGFPHASVLRTNSLYYLLHNNGLLSDIIK